MTNRKSRRKLRCRRTRFGRGAFASDEIDCLVPGQFLKFVGAATRAVFPPSFADRRASHTQRRMHHPGNSGEHRRRGRIVVERLAADDAFGLNQRGEGAPMRQ